MPYPWNRIREITQIFLKLGILGFGGPAAHIAMMEEEVVHRRQWLTRSHFIDLIGATNLIPGPNSTEMAIHVGYLYAGLPGLVIAGICFILPAVLITIAVAFIYVQFETLPQFAPLLYGIKPAVIAIILEALWRLGKKAIKNRLLLIIGLGVIALLLAGMSEIIALLLGGILGMILIKISGKGDQSPPSQKLMGLVGILGVSAAIKSSGVSLNPIVPPSLWKLGLFFLKIGSILYGSGYVLFAFLEGDLIGKYGWLTQQQLLDAIAIGQFTPGPILSTATFIGYLILGFPGAIVATIGIFLPSFMFVLILNPLIPKLRQSTWTDAFLDAVNVSAIALMAAVTFTLAKATFIQSLGNFPIDLFAILITVVAAILSIRFRITSAYLILGSAILGYLIRS